MEIDMHALPGRLCEVVERGEFSEFLAEDEFSDWIEESPSLSGLSGSDSFVLYDQVIEDMAAFQHVEFPGREAFLSLARRLFAHEYDSDLPIGDQDECYPAVFKPDTVVALKSLAAEFDLGHITRSHELLAAHPDVGMQSNSEDFVTSIQSAVELVNAAAADGRCIVVFLG